MQAIIKPGVPMKHLACILLLSLLSSSLLADYPVEVLQLKRQSADQVIPLIKPFIDKDGSVAGMNDRLVIRTSPANMQQIRKIISQLDMPPRRLMIYLRQGPDAMPQRGGQDTGGDAGADSGHIVGLPSDRGQVQPGKIVGLPTAGPATSAAGIHAGTRSDREQTQRVQAVEGEPAYIETGTQIPVYDGAVAVGPFGYGGAVNTRFKNATTGFYALARTDGDRVRVDISSQQIRQGSANDRFDTQSARTSVSGRLGEWIPLGGSARGGFNDRAQGGISATTSSNRDHSFYLKVEALD